MADARFVVANSLDTSGKEKNEKSAVVRLRGTREENDRAVDDRAESARVDQLIFFSVLIVPVKETPAPPREIRPNALETS